MIERLQENLHYTFNKPELLEQAITHRSYLNEHPDHQYSHYERLEFLGDAILQYIASAFLYDRFPSMAEGRMTRLRAWLVRTETLASFSRQLEIGPLIRMARGEEIEGGRDRDSILCDVFEAIIGAMYLDSNLATVQRFAMYFLEPTLSDVMTRQQDKDPKSLFQEWVQAIFRITPTYQVLEEIGTEHDKTFKSGVMIENVLVGMGEGRNKQSAEQLAAEHALNLVRVGALPYPPTNHTAAR